MNDSGRESAASEKAADQEVHEWAMGDLNPRPLPCESQSRTLTKYRKQVEFRALPVHSGYLPLPSLLEIADCFRRACGPGESHTIAFQRRCTLARQLRRTEPRAVKT